MDEQIEFLENGDYKFIMNLVDDKMPILRRCENFTKKYTELYNIINELEVILDDKQKEKFNEIVKLFYDVEEYYFAFSYSLGINYGRDLEKLK